MVMKQMTCNGCGREPSEIGEYVQEAAYEYTMSSPHSDETPWEKLSEENQRENIDRWAWYNEGTMNWENGHFLCTECYLKAGMPSAPGGWKAP